MCRIFRTMYLCCIKSHGPDCTPTSSVRCVFPCSKQTTDPSHYTYPNTDLWTTSNIPMYCPSCWSNPSISHGGNLNHGPLQPNPNRTATINAFMSVVEADPRITLGDFGNQIFCISRTNQIDDFSLELEITALLDLMRLEWYDRLKRGVELAMFERYMIVQLMYVIADIMGTKWSRELEHAEHHGEVVQLDDDMIELRLAALLRPVSFDSLSEGSENCPICLCPFGGISEDTGEKRMPHKLSCGHVFCKEDISRIYSTVPSTCPMCRDKAPNEIQLGAELPPHMLEVRQRAVEERVREIRELEREGDKLLRSVMKAFDEKMIADLPMAVYANHE